MSWEISIDRPVYIQLVELIERKILSGEYPAGEKIKSVRELAQEAQVNPNTMQRALQELETKGLIITQRTSGKTVTDDTEKINCIKKKIIDETVIQLLKQAKMLNISKNELITLISEHKEEN